MESKPLIIAPAVSVIVAELGRRPAWQHGEPFKVPASLWKAASEEMEAIMLKRGFKLPVSKAVKAEHFLIQGTPIVAHG
jgi:hypothetical protein